MDRRHFLSVSGAALLAGCTSKEQRQASYDECILDNSGERLRIDAHCHLINLQDVNAGPFLARRFFDLDEKAPPGVEAIASFGASVLGDLLKVTTTTSVDEAFQIEEYFEKRRGQKNTEDSEFCEYADRYQTGFLKANKKTQVTGMFSNRVRNAARMMYIFPEVDIFLPSMVDLYDRRRSFGPLEHQIKFYEHLNLATNGRFLPLVSFSPQKQFFLEGEGVKYDYFHFIRQAIEQQGFVGVKVHPSSGFSPLNNLRYGCTNSKGQFVEENDKELRTRFSKYDEYMEKLFEICMKFDVPILTHNSVGLSANTQCMRNFGSFPRDQEGEDWTYPYKRRLKRNERKPNRDELQWTNSPQQWVEAMEKASKKHSNKSPKVYLGHFAGAFEHLEDGELSRIPKPSKWLAYTAENIGKAPGLYVDLSEVNELFYTPNGSEKPELKPNYAAAFRDLISSNRTFANRMLYGTDWHMPASARTCPHYVALIEELLGSNRLRDKTMGENAVSFFGLGRGGQNRDRLEQFYSRHGIPLSEIKWMNRVDGKLS